MEDKVLALPAIKEAKIPPLFQKFVQDILPRVNLPKTSAEVLQMLTRKDAKATEVAKVIRMNQYYELQFIKHINSLTQREETPSIDASVVLLGMTNSRNLLAMLQMLRTIQGRHPEWDEGGKLVNNPKDTVKCGVSAEDEINKLLPKDEIGYTELAFAAGLVHDYLLHTSIQMGLEGGKVMEFQDRCFKQGLRAAQVGMILSQKIDDFPLRKYAYAAGLLHNVGQSALAMVDPDYVTFMEEARKKEVPNSVIMFAEEKKYGFSSAELGSLICFNFSIFRPIEKAIACQAYPVAIRSDKQLNQMASVVALTASMTRHFKKTNDPKDSAVKKWKGAEVDFQIPVDALLQTVDEATF